MANNSRISINSLDFDGIKQNLKDYLKSQTVFTDYNFEGSGINILLDILSANTHYLGFYMNMVANETFIDSAVTRESVVSIAKHIGYTPRSAISAKSIVNINFGTTRPTISGQNFDYLPTGIIFRTEKDGKTYNFVTTQSYKLKINANNEYYIDGIEIVEGTITNTNYIVNELDTTQKYIIPSKDVDINTLVVRVQQSIDDTTGFVEKWSLATDYVSIGSDSPVYFLEEDANGYYRIYFGDDIIGRKVKNGNLITIQYLITSGPDANEIGIRDSIFSRTFNIPSIPSGRVSVVSPSSGGKDKETIESIRFNAPRYYQAQNRAVTAEDYRSIVSSEYGDAESIYVYGGEDADPPQYGKVFVSIKPTEGTQISDFEKLNIANNILGERNVLGITPEIIDPDIIYVNVTSNVTYDPSQTNFTDSQIESQVRNVIVSYNRTELGKFNRTLYFSKFTKNIDDSITSVLGNQTSFTMTKYLQIEEGQSLSYQFTFANPIFHPEDGYKSVLSSSSFTYYDGSTNATAFLDDDGNGNIRIYKLNNNAKQILNSSIGTINYSTGSISLVSFNPLSTLRTDSNILITVEPANKNLISKRNIIFTIDEDSLDSINITATPVTEFESGNTNSGVPFPFDAR